jgi:NADH dehydrogenase
MEIRNVLVIGGAGFIGRHLVNQLAAWGINIIVPTRQRERAKELILLPTVDVVEANIHDAATLAQLVRGKDAVINLVGVLHDGRGTRSFKQAHVVLPQKIIAACQAAGVKRLLHMSALGADTHGPSAYLRSKGEGEAAVRASELEWTVFRPSVVFGRGDAFVNLFARLLSLSPVVLLGCPNAHLQPVFVEDVAQTFIRSLTERDSFGRAYDLCGPKVYTLRELIEIIGVIIQKPRPIIGLGSALSYLQALALECLPGKLMTRDNYRSLQVASVCDCTFPFGITPAALEAIVPLYLGQTASRASYSNFRGERGAINPEETL